MDWKQLSKNPPAESCDILCRVDRGGYTETYVAAYDARVGTYCAVNRYGMKVAKELNASEATEGHMYAVIE